MKRLLILFLLLYPWVAFAQGGERILKYDSFITIAPAGDMTVTETITVVCEGNQIKHGIYRDFPTRYKDRHNTTVRVDFEVRSVTKDGKPEPWWTEDAGNGVRLYVGDKGIFLEPGEYTYVLTYHTDRQLGFFQQHDELYWNVTGNGWEFAIEQADATVELPPGAEVLSTEAYTGFSGEQGTDFTAGRDDQGRARFSTTRALQPQEGLTIVVTWSKGVIEEPTDSEKAKAFLADNGSSVAGAAGIAVLLIYYLIAWFKIGKDPAKGVIIPLYEAPKGFSPAAVRYVVQMGFDDKAFAAAVVNMAVKGCLTIDEDSDEEYTLTWKGKDYSGLSSSEAQAAKQLFRNGNSLVVATANHATIKHAIDSLRKSLAVEYEKIYFLTNKITLIPGLLISVITMAAIVLLGWNRVVAGMMTIWLSGWTLGCAFLVYVTFSAWKAVIAGHSRKASDLFSAVLLLPFTLPFLAGEGFGLWIFTEATSLPAVVSIFLIVLFNILFYHWMKTFTIKGRQVMDQIEGLKLYLAVAEKDRLNHLNPPEKTPEIFEKFLPYALALDVEQQWCEQFTEVLARSGAEKEYAPAWYSGSRFTSHGVAGLGSSLGTMSSSISSSSSPPGSSSGSGGGGSSGGGGGGGGGGGW